MNHGFSGMYSSVADIKRSLVEMVIVKQNKAIINQLILEQNVYVNVCIQHTFCKRHYRCKEIQYL